MRLNTAWQRSPDPVESMWMTKNLFSAKRYRSLIVTCLGGPANQIWEYFSVTAYTNWGKISISLLGCTAMDGPIPVWIHYPPSQDPREVSFVSTVPTFHIQPYSDNQFYFPFRAILCEIMPRCHPRVRNMSSLSIPIHQTIKCLFITNNSCHNNRFISDCKYLTPVLRDSLAWG